MSSRPEGLATGHPLAAGDLGAFLAGSRATLLGRVEPGDPGAGVFAAANPALGARLPGPCPVSLADALTPGGLRRWRRAALGLGADGRGRVVVLRFVRSGGAFRCLLSAGVGGAVWLVGEPRRPAPGALRRALALAYTDPLTGLANRRQAERWLSREATAAARRGTHLACLVVDLDGLKAVNDAEGHPAGDRVLTAAAGALAGAVRAGDRVARFGGDEFLVLLPATDAPGARSVAERIRARLAPVTAGIGLAVARLGEAGPALLARADLALLRAKRGGGDRVEADP